MAMTAYEEMNQFWKKNLELKRPNSPWWIYRCCSYSLLLLVCITIPLMAST